MVPPPDRLGNAEWTAAMRPGSARHDSTGSCRRRLVGPMVGRLSRGWSCRTHYPVRRDRTSLEGQRRPGPRRNVPSGRSPRPEDRMRRVLRDNGLSITMFALFLVFLVAQSIAGYRATNSDNTQHRQPPQSYGQYLTSGAFMEATFENWESEFLQMGAYVVLPALLIQRGSPESKKPDGDEVDTDPRDRRDAQDVPGPVKRGGLVLTLYAHSLSIALLALFLVSLFLPPL